MAHYKQVVVSSWIVQALHFYSDKMKTEQSSNSDGGKDPLICSLGPKDAKNSHTCMHCIIIKKDFLKN